MKRNSLIVFGVCCLLLLSACGSSDSKTDITVDGALTGLQEKISDVSSVIIYNEETDPNENLGRPGQYIGKGDFFDGRSGDTENEAGTIEFFATKSDCSDRYKYLCKLADPELGVFGVTQYIYKYDKAVFRVSFDLTPTQAEEYKTAMDEIMGEVSEQYEGD